MMKIQTYIKFLTVLLLFNFTQEVISQSGLSRFNYQAVVRDNDGKILPDQPVNLNINIENSSGEVVYTESQSSTTNEFGLVNIVVGNNDPNTEIDDVSWGEDQFYLQMNVDIAGSTISFGKSEILGSPFANVSNESMVGTPGPQGEQGLQGEQGVQGPQGMTGPQGPQGEQGIQGPAGQDGQDGTGVSIVGSVNSSNDLPPSYNGNIGDMLISTDDGQGHVWDGNTWIQVGQIQGPAGPQGPQGVQGAQGPAGQDGNDGAQGPQGMTGPQGPDGNDGAQGPQGMTGPQGPAGQDGNDGAQGPQGMTGPQGPAGQDGNDGAQGPQGPAGTYNAGTGITIGNNTISTNAILPTNPAGGDLNGSYQSPQVDGIRGILVPNPPTSPANEVLTLINGSSGPEFVWLQGGSSPWIDNTTSIQYNDIIIPAGGLPRIQFDASPSTSIENNGGAVVWRNNNVGQMVLEAGSALEPWVSSLLSLGSSTFRWSEVWAANGTIQTSDARLKKNIKPLSSALNKVMDLNPVTYNWKKGDTSSLQIGFLAQELEAVIPEAVIYKKLSEEEKLKASNRGRIVSEDTYGVNYSKIIPVLTKAIQELQEQNQALVERIIELEKER